MAPYQAHDGIEYYSDTMQRAVPQQRAPIAMDPMVAAQMAHPQAHPQARAPAHPQVHPPHPQAPAQASSLHAMPPTAQHLDHLDHMGGQALPPQMQQHLMPDPLDDDEDSMLENVIVPAIGSVSLVRC